MEFGLYGARCSHIALLPHVTVDGTVNKLTTCVDYVVAAGVVCCRVYGL